MSVRNLSPYRSDADLILRVRTLHRARFGEEPRLFTAPGRVNLIGEHTDYTEGFVLPMAIDRSTLVSVSPRSDGRVVACSLDAEGVLELQPSSPPPRSGTWTDYVLGVSCALGERGIAVRGASLLVGTTIPIGGGVSSSAALELATARALAAVSGLERPNPVELALAGQRAEHEWVGTRCGIMDQLVVALAEPGTGLLIDCRTLHAEPIPIPLGCAVLVADSGVHHDLAASAYNERRRECELAAGILAGALPGVKTLRDVDSGSLERSQSLLPATLAKRARHVVTENDRTLEMATALRVGDLREAGRLVTASHRSLRDDYEVSSPELDVLVEAAVGHPGVFGAKMTGGGFGGCTVSLVRADAAEDVERRLVTAFRARFDRDPRCFVTRAAAGVREIRAASSA